MSDSSARSPIAGDDAVSGGATRGSEKAPIVVMGVSGSGKSTVGKAVADALGRTFVDGDGLHSPENRAKMASGVPLTDEDRWPWLDSVAGVLASLDDQGNHPVVACSALRRAYRDRLRAATPGIVFLHLHGSPALLASRLGPRKHEYMPASLLASQLDTLEPLAPDEQGVVVDIAPPPAQVTAAALQALSH
ncbi:gluconokinase [Planctomonas deserti]|uniref:gluconokinase n=1 Tax=Planctomonas deserti TaxID=2144185 RepID=UPI001F0C00A0|nr:gluconokinase [Planctomonas deserti]